MNINKYPLYIVLAFALTVSVAYGAGSALVKYPIAELGSCGDKAACQKYCEDTDNMESCINFGEKNSLISGEEARIGKLAVGKIKSGNTPGKCKSKAECENYCSGNVTAINECIAFGEGLGAIPPEELAQAKKIAAALQSGAKMPGSCTNKKSCESYCSSGENIDECLSFAEVSGILPEKELAEAKKVAKFIKNGETPGKCTNKESCNTYCAKDSHMDECLGFAEKAGLVSKGDAEMARKVGGKGPGGCKGKDSCEAYCNDESKADECLQFAMDKGLIPAEDLEKIAGGSDMIKKGLDQIPADARTEVEACLKERLGAPSYEKLMSGGRPTRNMGGKIEKCFNDTMGGYAKKMMKKATGGKGLPEGVNPEDFKNGAPSSEQIEKIKEKMIKNVPGGIPEGVDVEQFKSGPPSAEQIEKIKEQMMQKSVPQGIPEGVDTSQFESGAPSAEQIEQIKAQVMKNIPQGGQIPQDAPTGEPVPVPGNNGMGL